MTLAIKLAGAPYDQAMGDVQRTDVDGVPTFWIDRPGPLMATLSFRVGQADETLPTRGISHLVEHLGLFQLSHASCQFNGATEDSFTSFYATGTPEEVTDFLTRVATALASLPLERMDMEKQVIKTEDASRGASFIAEMLQRRFGPAGHGLLACEEFGMRSLPPQAVAVWAAENFSRQNAVLAITSPPPAGLRLPLVDGVGRRPLPAVAPVPQEYPTITVHHHQILGASFLAARSTALTSLMRIIQRRAMDHLRTELGVSYSITADYRRLDHHQAHLTVTADTLPEVSTQAMDGLLHVLLSLARTGPTGEELDRDFEEAQKAFAQEDALLGDLIRAARYELVGEEPQSRARLLREQREVTPDLHAELLDNALESSFWLVPAGTSGPTWRFRDYVASSPYAVLQSKVLQPLPGTDVPPGATLLVSREGVTYSMGQDRQITVLFRACAGALIWNNGDRMLYGDDGFILLIEPRKWDGGQHLLQMVDHELPAHVRIPMGDRQVRDGPPTQPIPAAAMNVPESAPALVGTTAPVVQGRTGGLAAVPVRQEGMPRHSRFHGARNRASYALLAFAVMAWGLVVFAASTLSAPLAAGETQNNRIALLVLFVFLAVLTSAVYVRRLF